MKIIEEHILIANLYKESLFQRIESEQKQLKMNGIMKRYN